MLRSWFATVLTLLLLLPAANAIACRRAVTPDLYPLDAYSQIFVGEVTGIRLTDYEDYRRRQLHPAPAGSDEVVLDDIYVTSSTPAFQLIVVVVEQLVGDAEPVSTLMLGGCNVSTPTLKQKGIFFLHPGGQVIAVFEGDGEFDDWLKASRNAGEG